MTNELYDKVCAYRISMSVIKSMLKSNIIDLNNYCIDIADISVETLNDAFNNLVKNYSDYKKHLRDIHENMKSEAYKSTAAVIDILEEGK